MLYFSFLENSFNFITQKLAKNYQKYHFSRLRQLIFDLKESSKSFYKMLPITNFQNASPRFARKRLQFHHSKIRIKVKTTIFKLSEHLFLTYKHLENHFLNHLLWPTLDLNSFEDFYLLCQKMVSTLSLNNLEKSIKSHCQMFITFIFDLKVALKPFSSFRVKPFWIPCFAFPENCFNLVPQKFSKKWKMSFLNTQDIHFWYQGNFRTIIYNLLIALMLLISLKITQHLIGHLVICKLIGKLIGHFS